jgi:2-oxoglutarate ferredoxin oxidoreductase subunit alpha
LYREKKMKKALISGNDAVGYGALNAQCTHYFGYPITPQNEIVEFFARELPKAGGVFVQSESETSSINMLYGAAATGVRAMTSSASTGFSLMMEGLSATAAAELPCVIVDVQGGGPGAGSTQTAQMDYHQVTKGGGHGDYHCIVLAPFSVQETHDFVQLAFHLADKYHNPTIILMDAIIGHTREAVELKSLEFPPTPEKKFALVGSAARGGERHLVTNIVGIQYVFNEYLAKVNEKFKAMKADEVRWEGYQLEDAELGIIAYGSSARMSLRATAEARKRGHKVGLLRPITLWPFPQREVKELAGRVKHLIVVEDSLGQMVDDVRLLADGLADVHLVGVLDRHLPTCNGMIFPQVIVDKIESLLS